MKIVVDTNVLMTFFWKGSVFERIVKHFEIDCYSPEYALEEINKYKEHIIKKAKITKKEFDEKKLELAIYVTFVSLEEYQENLKKALKISPDSNDIDFFSLALTLKSPIWTNDKELKKQYKIPIFSTEELLENPKYLGF